MDDATPTPRSPWERPIPGQEPSEFQLVQSPATAPPSPARVRPTRWLIAAACVALAAAAAVAFVAVRGDEPVEQADGLTEVEDVPPDASAPVDSTIADQSTPSTTVVTSVRPSTQVPTPSTIGPTDVAPGTYSFAAATSLSEAAAQRFRMTTTTDGEPTVVEGVIDAQQRIQISTTVGQEIAVDVVLDVIGGVAYYSGTTFDDMITGDAEWVAVDLEEALADTGQSLDSLRQNISGAAAIVSAVDGNEPASLGLTDIEGETVMLYEVTMDKDQVLASFDANPQVTPGGMTSDMVDYVNRLRYAFYVTESSVIRRLTATFDIAGEPFETTYDYFPLEAGFEVQIPDPATVERVDASAMG